MTSSKEYLFGCHRTKVLSILLLVLVGVGFSWLWWLYFRGADPIDHAADLNSVGIALQVYARDHPHFGPMDLQELVLGGYVSADKLDRIVGRCAYRTNRISPGDLPPNAIMVIDYISPGWPRANVLLASGAIINVPREVLEPMQNDKRVFVFVGEDENHLQVVGEDKGSGVIETTPDPLSAPR